MKGKLPNLIKRMWDKKKIIAVSCTVGIVLIIGVILIVIWQTGLFGHSMDTTPYVKPPSTAEEAVIQDYTPSSLEGSVISVPPYDPVAVTREEEIHLTRERPIVDKFRSVPSEMIPPLDSLLSPSLTPIPAAPEPVANQLHQFVEYILFINLDDAKDKKDRMEKEISKLNFHTSVIKERLSAVRRSNSNLSQLLSHIACLSKALTLKKNVLILEDDCEFLRTDFQIMKVLSAIKKWNGDRWDVICFTQENIEQWQLLTTTEEGIHICKLIKGCSTSYLVNKQYLPKLLAFFIQQLRAALHKQKNAQALSLCDMQRQLQSTDVWIGFHVPFAQTPRERGLYLSGLEAFVNQVDDKIANIVLSPQQPQQKILICNIAFGSNNHHVSGIQRDCYLKIFKLHQLEFCLFTDQDTQLSATTEEGAVLHVIPLQADDLIHKDENLYRFTILEKAIPLFDSFDYVFYIDMDYRIYQHPFENNLLVQGLVGASHLHELLNTVKITDHLENRKESTAYVPAQPAPQHLFSVGFHGGEAQAYMLMVKQLAQNVKKDLALNIICRHGDEGHLNAFYNRNLPTSILSQSYMFSERCLDLHCHEPVCQLLRESSFAPVMGKIESL